MEGVLLTLIIVLLHIELWLLLPSLFIYGLVFYKSLSKGIFWGIAIIISLGYSAYILIATSYFTSGIYQLLAAIFAFLILLLAVKAATLPLYKSKK